MKDFIIYTFILILAFIPFGLANTILQVWLYEH